MFTIGLPTYATLAIVHAPGPGQTHNLDFPGEVLIQLAQPRYTIAETKATRAIVE